MYCKTILIYENKFNLFVTDAYYYIQKIYVFLFVNGWKCNVKPNHLYNYMMFYLVSSFIVKLLFFKDCQIVSITVKQIFSKYFVECKKCLKICYFFMVINV